MARTTKKTTRRGSRSPRQAPRAPFERNPAADTFILIAYDVLRGNKPDGAPREFMHTVFSGFNQNFRKVFSDPEIDPIAYCQSMADQGLLQLALVRGGRNLKPCPLMLSEPNAEQKALAGRFRKMLSDYVAEKERKRKENEAAKAAAEAQKPSGSARERAAQQLLQKGSVSDALKKLGY